MSIPDNQDDKELATGVGRGSVYLQGGICDNDMGLPLELDIDDVLEELVSGITRTWRMIIDSLAPLYDVGRAYEEYRAGLPWYRRLILKIPGQDLNDAEKREAIFNHLLSKYDNEDDNDGR